MNYIDILQTNNLRELKVYLNSHDINEEIYEQSLLYLSVFLNNFAFTKYLIQCGAKINKYDRLGRTPLQIACYFGFYNIADFLLKNGAIVDDICFKNGNRGWDNNKQTEIINLLKKHTK